MASAAFLGAGGHGGVEAHDHRAGGGGQVDVGFGDLARCRQQHPHLYLILGQLLERSEDGFHGALNVGLENQVEFLQLTVIGLSGHGRKRDAS